jgi:hypothetical protein
VLLRWGDGLEVGEVEVLVGDEGEQDIGSHARRRGVDPKELLGEHDELVADVDQEPHVRGVARDEVEQRPRHGAIRQTEVTRCGDEVMR